MFFFYSNDGYWVLDFCGGSVVAHEPCKARGATQNTISRISKILTLTPALVYAETKSALKLSSVYLSAADRAEELMRNTE